MNDNYNFLRSLSAMNIGHRREPCRVHGPLLIRAFEEGAYAALCLTCGAIGPERADGWEAKLAFDESFRSTG
jgi:hypothetical protein